MFNTLSLTRQELCNIMRSSEHSEFENQFTFLKEQIKTQTICSEGNGTDVCNKLTYIKSQFKSIGEKPCRIEKRFVKNDQNWLDT